MRSATAEGHCQSLCCVVAWCVGGNVSMITAKPTTGGRQQDKGNQVTICVNCIKSFCFFTKHILGLHNINVAGVSEYNPKTILVRSEPAEAGQCYPRRKYIFFFYDYYFLYGKQNGIEDIVSQARQHALQC